METVIMLSRSSRNYKNIFATQQEQKMLDAFVCKFLEKKIVCN
jgi:hypothetical protein